MEPLEKWIWLDEQRYPDAQSTVYSGFSDKAEAGYAVAEFHRRYDFDKPVARAHLRFSGDTEFALFLNGRLLATGPAPVGGDFLYNNVPRPQHYASELSIEPGCRTLEFFARVKMMPVAISEYSQGRGGFMLTAHLVFEDGAKAVLTTDSSWQARRNGAYTAAASPLTLMGPPSPYPTSGTALLHRCRPAARKGCCRPAAGGLPCPPAKPCRPTCPLTGSMPASSPLTCRPRASCG